MPKVVAVSGASGAGKTTLVKRLAERTNSPSLLFDDHQPCYPSDMKQWLENGADVSLIRTESLSEKLIELKQNSSHQFIFVEEPFGRGRDSMKFLIDFVVLLDTPLPICLKRILARHEQQVGDKVLVWRQDYMKRYDDHLKDIYRVAVQQIRQDCDLVVSEVVTIERTSEMVLEWLKRS